MLPAGNKFSKFPLSKLALPPDSGGVENAQGKVQQQARPTTGVLAPLTACDVPAQLPPGQRGGRAHRLHTARFEMPIPQQFALLNLPEVRRFFVWQRRVLLVSVANAMLDRDLCSQNVAADLLHVAASQLCVMRQKFRGGGDAALRPWSKTPGAATGCRISFFVKTS